MSDYGGRPQLMLPKLTPAVKAVMIAFGAIYVLELVLVNWLGRLDLLALLWLRPSSVTDDWWAWQLVTYPWVHDPTNPTQLLFNLLGLWLIGAMLEKRWGTGPFMKFFLLTAFWGGVTVVVLRLIFGIDGPILGAAAAIDALLIGFGILYPDMPIYFFGILPLKGKHFAIILVGLQLLYAAAGGDPITLAVHFGGMAAGALLVTGLWRPSRLRLKLFGEPKPGPRRPVKASHLKAVPKEPDDDDEGGNGKSRMLH